jgi:hypothetical protein
MKKRRGPVIGGGLVGTVGRLIGLRRSPALKGPAAICCPGISRAPRCAQRPTLAGLPPAAAPRASGPLDAAQATE